MNPEPSTSQGATTSTSTESSLKQMPDHDVADFGLSCELSDLNLPTISDILRYFFFLTELAKNQSQKYSYRTFSLHVTDKVIEIWSKLDVELFKKASIFNKLNALIEKYQAVDKHKERDEYKAFVQSTKELFYIGKCKCDLKTAKCTCGLIPDHLKDFMLDQHNERKSTIPEYVEEIEEQAPRSTLIPTEESSHEIYQPTEDIDIDFGATRRGPYTPRYDAPNFAMMCDRFGVPDRVASALATCLMKDIDVKDHRGNCIIMDKSKVLREKNKCRDEVLRKRYDSSNLMAFSFDGRKDDSLTREKIGEKFHTKMVREPHLVVLREPGAQLIGYINLEHEDAHHKHTKLNEFFTGKALCLDSLIGICCDGEPTNTGKDNGILRIFEVHLKRPLHWFVCLLHFNELPFRHLFDALEKSITTGPKTKTGKLSKQIETCEKLPVCNCYNLFIIIFNSTFQLLCSRAK